MVLFCHVILHVIKSHMILWVGVPLGKSPTALPSLMAIGIGSRDTFLVVEGQDSTCPR